MFDWSELTLFIYVVARMSGFVLFNPILGRNNIPVIYRTGFTLVLSVSAIASVAARQAVVTPVGLADLAIRIVLELAIGFFLGMVMQFFFYIPQLAGTVVDNIFCNIRITCPSKYRMFITRSKISNNQSFCFYYHSHFFSSFHLVFRINIPVFRIRF